MNRELQKLLREKWFLVAADLIAVIAILCVIPDKRDGFDTFLVISAILIASAILIDKGSWSVLRFLVFGSPLSGALHFFVGSPLLAFGKVVIGITPGH